jgi:hypothetical protein
VADYPTYDVQDKDKHAYREFEPVNFYCKTCAEHDNFTWQMVESYDSGDEVPYRLHEIECLVADHECYIQDNRPVKGMQTLVRI